MKKQIIILGLGFILINSTQAVTYYNNRYYPTYTPINQKKLIYYPTQKQYIYPYSNQYYYTQINANNPSRLKRLQRIKKLKRKMNNQISWWKNSKFQGTPTGWSVPIQGNMLPNFNNNYSNNLKNLPNSPTCDTDLWSNPTANDSYYRNGKKFIDDRETKSKTGVTIIYD